MASGWPPTVSTAAAQRAGKQRPIGVVENVVAVENRVRAESAQPIVLLALAGDGLHFVTEFREDGDRERTDAARRAGDDHRSAIGRDAARRRSPLRIGRR